MAQVIEIAKTKFQPQFITILLDCEETLIDNVYDELKFKAELDSNYCWGYFPDMPDKNKIDKDLPACKEFAENVPNIIYDKIDLKFNFLRLSLSKQSGESPYHLDSDAKTALTGDTSTVADREVWRLLLNLSDKYSRKVSYLDIDPMSIKLNSNNGYVNCPNKYVNDNIKRTITLKPRRGLEISSVLFCASRVLHTGKDDNNGHFVAGYGCER